MSLLDDESLVVEHLRKNPGRPVLDIGASIWPQLDMWAAEDLARKALNRLYRRKRVRYEIEYKYRPGRTIKVKRWSLR